MKGWNEEVSSIVYCPYTSDDVRGMQLFVTQASPCNVCLHRLLRMWLPPDTRQISMIGKVMSTVRNNIHHTCSCFAFYSQGVANCVQLPPKWHHEEVEVPSWDSLNSYTHRDDCPTMSSLTSGFTPHKYFTYIESCPCQGLLYEFVWFCPGSVNPPWRVDVIRYPLTGQWKPTTAHQQIMTALLM